MKNIGMRNDDSSDDEPVQTDMERIEDKNRVLVEKLYKSEKEKNSLKELVDMI